MYWFHVSHHFSRLCIASSSSRYQKALAYLGFIHDDFSFPLWMNKKNKILETDGQRKKNGVRLTSGQILISGRCWLPVASYRLPEMIHQHWLMVIRQRSNSLLPSFIQNGSPSFICKNKIYILKPIEGHGLWDGKRSVWAITETIFIWREKLLCATIRVSHLKISGNMLMLLLHKWVLPMVFIESYGIGEVPWMAGNLCVYGKTKRTNETFTYRMKGMQEVIKKQDRRNGIGICFWGLSGGGVVWVAHRLHGFTPNFFIFDLY